MTHFTLGTKTVVVSDDDAVLLAYDALTFGNCYVKRTDERYEGEVVHERINPSRVLA